MRCVVGLVCVLLLGIMPVVGCDDGVCRAALGDYCDGPCPTWEQTIAAVEELSPGLYCCRCDATAGRCGESGYRYVLTQCLDFGDSKIEVFNRSGTLIAVEFCTDTPSLCGNSLCIQYGYLPECELEEEQNLCDGGCAGMDGSGGGGDGGAGGTGGAEKLNTSTPTASRW